MSSLSPSRTVIMHFYNEAYLLPWWCQHHYPLFDHGILIDYDSTDGSADIIRQYCPGWEVRRSRNRYFGANECDWEILLIESELSGWRIALTATEFIIGDFKKLENETRPELFMNSYTMVDPVIRGENYPSYDKSLLLQNHHGYDWPDRSGRSFRQETMTYITGRHKPVWATETNTTDFAILWYGFAPYNEHTLKRKLQIQTRIPASDFAYHLGLHHKTTEGNLRRQISQHSKNTADLKQYINSFPSCQNLK